MTMWDVEPMGWAEGKMPSFGERTSAWDPRRKEFLYHVPEYDEEGNLVSGSPDYYRHDPTPSASGHANRQPGSFGLGTSFKDDASQAGPAEVVRDSVQMSDPASMGEGVSPYPYPGPEQLKRDTYWALGDGRSFQWPGGLEQAQNGHNIAGKNGFSLENSGTDDEPIPSYRHVGTGSRIEPSGDEDAPWTLHSENYDNEERMPFGSTNHTSAAAAAMAHQAQLDSNSAYHERNRHVYNPPTTPYRPYDPAGDYARSRPRTRTPSRGRGSRPTNVHDAMRHAVGTASYIDGAHDPVEKASWDLRNMGTTYGGHPSQLHTSHGQLNGYVADQYQRDLDAGKVQHVIYHYQTPLAWLKVDPDENASGGTRHTWVVPDERYSNTSSKRQSSIRSAIRSTGHGDAIEEPFDPARGFPNAITRPDPEAYGSHSQAARSRVAEGIVGDLAEQGFHRPGYNTRQKAVFLRPTVETQLSPYNSYTQMHGTYLRPVQKQDGSGAWVAGEHLHGTNRIQGSKRFDTLEDALAHADAIHSWIRNGAQGEMPRHTSAAWGNGFINDWSSYLRSDAY